MRGGRTGYALCAPRFRGDGALGTGLEQPADACVVICRAHQKRFRSSESSLDELLTEAI